MKQNIHLILIEFFLIIREKLITKYCKKVNNPFRILYIILKIK